MVLMRMGRNEYIDIEIFRLNKDRQLAIATKWEMCEAFRAAIAKVKIDSNEHT